MGDYHVLMQFDIDGEPTEVTEAIRTADGVRAWWSDAVDGDPGTEGSRFRVGFPDLPRPFELDVATSTDQRTEWRVGGFPPWWDGTTIRFDVGPNPDGDGSRLAFSHRDYDPDNPVIPVITPAWAGILGRLQQYVEHGTRDPFAVN